MEDGNHLSMERERNQVMAYNMKIESSFTKDHSSKAKEMVWAYLKCITVQAKLRFILDNL